jgi:hypothetical protein
VNPSVASVDEAVAPAGVYGERLAERRAAGADLAARERVLSNFRLAVFVLGVLTLVGVVALRWFGPIWLAPPVLGFLVLVIWHDRVIRARERADRAAAFYARGLARLDGSWPGGGNCETRFADPHHPYAADLDLFGEGSVFELLCTARTAAGESRLAAWLCAPAAPDEVLARQAAVAELRPRLELREDLALLGEDVRAGVHPSVLAEWGAEPALHGAGTWRILAGVLALCSLASLAAWILIGAGPIPFLFVMTLEAVVALKFRGVVAHALHAAEQPARDLALLSETLRRLERERFDSPRLVALRRVMETEGVPASAEIERLRRLIELADARRNQLFAPLAAILLWGVQFALAIEVWRARSGAHVAEWLEAVGEIEALGSLAGHAWEHPDDPFPEVRGEGPVFRGEGLAHPLLPGSAAVRNDVSLHRGAAVLVISGSNMSGKSTLLRTVGTNAVLALAGGVVRAHGLALSTLSVGASIRVNDSLQEGASRFYAEIKRLRQVVDLASDEAHPLFLLDEILHGTNSHDRQIGAAAVVRGLVERGAIGLVTTHDLALASIADELAPRAKNVHFVDHLEDGHIAFDYTLREGVVEKSNALALMREVGLEV